MQWAKFSIRIKLASLLRYTVYLWIQKANPDQRLHRLPFTQQIWHLSYCNNPTFWDKQTSANSVDPDQTSHISRVTRVYIVCHSFSNFGRINDSENDLKFKHIGKGEGIRIYMYRVTMVI